jgi:hypothetical protein
MKNDVINAVVLIGIIILVAVLLVTFGCTPRY